tara:strand:- start:2460 stop:3968 length:1509 start_codon:yes stop_codon:yes gene_type:complete
MSTDRRPGIRLFSHDDDTPHEARGMLIPRKRKKQSSHFTPTAVQTSSGPGSHAWGILVAVFALVAIGSFGVAGYGLFSKMSLVAAPIVTVVDPYSNTAATLEYGPQSALKNSSFFTETRDVFIDEGLTFVEVDLTSRQLRFFENGVLVLSSEIIRSASAGSWWQTPSGLYKVEKKDEKAFSNLEQMYFPWEIRFQSNFIIHGQPSYPDGSIVDSESESGGIQLTDEVAQALFGYVDVGTPVLVHLAPERKVDNFVYRAQVLDISAPRYFVADLDNGSILASSDLEDEASIASVTKLMTALVAAEKIDLDGRIRVTSPTFVTSLIPRLSERSSVSMYSLLQLLLVESSNEAAETIAGELGREEFIEAMNTKARQLGMLNTNFADPSGLSSENVSSVGDLYTLSKYIKQHKNFIFDITANQELTTAQSGGEFIDLVNFNQVEGLDNFAGGKVGETKAAGQTSVSLHTVDFQGEERTLVVILLGSSQRTEDIKSLIKHVQNRYGS